MALPARLVVKKTDIAKQASRLEHLNGELDKRSNKLEVYERKLSFDAFGAQRPFAFFVPGAAVFQHMGHLERVSPR